MKISLRTSELLAQLQLVSRVASTRSAVQALSGTKITAAADTAHLVATDAEMGLSSPLQADVATPGDAVVPARLLLDVVRSLPGDSVTLELRGAEQDVEIVSGSARFHLRTLRLEDFPALPQADAASRVVVPAGALVETIARVARSASRDETRPILTGILVSAADSTLRMVSTDSYRLSVMETPLESALSGTLEANVPARALQELSRIAQTTGAEEIAVSAGANQVVFEVAGNTLTSRLLDGQFPNYRQLIPEGVEHELRLATNELADVVRRVSLLAQKNTPLRLRFAEGELTVSAQTPDVGEASESIPVPFAGEPLEIGFNPEFLRDGIESVGEDDLVLKLISPLRPGLIESAGSGGFLYLIMPIRLNV